MSEGTEIYLSIDVEADGPIPGAFSLLSLGCAALTLDKELLGTFARNLAPLPPRGACWNLTSSWKRRPLLQSEVRP